MSVKSIEELLASLQLEKFTAKFREEEIDLDAARNLSDDDLKSLGIPMGPRRKLMDALKTQSSSPTSSSSSSSSGKGPSVGATSASSSSSKGTSSGQTVSKSLKDPGLLQWQFNGECASYGSDRPAAVARAWHPTGEPYSSSFRHKFITTSIGEGIVFWDLESGQSSARIKPKEQMFAIDVDPSKNILVAAGSQALIEVYDLSNNSLKGSLSKPAGLSDRFTEVCLVTLPGGAPQAAINVWKKVHTFDLETAKKITSIDTEIACDLRMIQDPCNPGVLLCAPFRASHDHGGKITLFDLRVKPVTAVKTLLGLSDPLISLNIAPTHHTPTGLVCGATESAVKLFDLRAGNSLVTLNPPKGGCFDGAEVNQSALGVFADNAIRAYDLNKVCKGDVAEPECEVIHSFCKRCSASVRWVSVLSEYVVINPMEYLAVAKWAK